MKSFAVTAVFVLLLAVVGVLIGVLDIHYVRMVDNQPLSNPIMIDRVDGTRIRLRDGRTIQLDEEASRWCDRGLLKAGFMIEIDNSAGDDYLVLRGDVPQTICDRTSALRIPLIPYDVERYWRGAIGHGTFSEESKEADQAETPSHSMPSSQKSWTPVPSLEDATTR